MKSSEFFLVTTITYYVYDLHIFINIYRYINPEDRIPFKTMHYMSRCLFFWYVFPQYALHVYDSLMSVGKDFGVRNAGYYALRALRTEKFFAYWGTDLTPHTTPMECGREYRVKFDVSINLFSSPLIYFYPRLY